MAVEPNRWGIIYNPKAGSRKTQKRWNEIRSYMENRKVVFDATRSFSATARSIKLLCPSWRYPIVGTSPTLKPSFFHALT